MKTNRTLPWIGLLSALLMSNCGGKREEEKDQERSAVFNGVTSALKEITASDKETRTNRSGSAVNFRSLQELLPTNADGLARKEITGNTNEAAGFTVSTATGKYANDDTSETIELTLVDAGSSTMSTGLAAWSILKVDKQTANGYERTGNLGTNKSYEKYDNPRKEGEIAVLVDKRFILTAEGRGVSMDQLKAALTGVDLNKLSELTKTK